MKNLLICFAVVIGVVAIYIRLILSRSFEHVLPDDLNEELNAYIYDRFVLKKYVPVEQQTDLWNRITVHRTRYFSSPYSPFNMFSLNESVKQSLAAEFELQNHTLQRTVLFDKLLFFEHKINLSTTNGCHRDFGAGMQYDVQRVFLSFEDSCLRMCEENLEFNPNHKREDFCLNCEDICSPAVIQPYKHFHDPKNGTNSLLFDFVADSDLWKSHVFDCFCATIYSFRWVADGEGKRSYWSKKFPGSEAGRNLKCNLRNLISAYLFKSDGTLH